MIQPGPLFAYPHSSHHCLHNYHGEHFGRVSEMSIQPFTSLNTSVVSKSSNEDCSFSSSCTNEPASFLRSPWISRLCPEMPLPISCKEPEQVTRFGPFQVRQVLEQGKYGLDQQAQTETLAREDDTDKRLVVSPFFQFQQQMATKFLSDNRGGGIVVLARDKVKPASPTKGENNIRSFQESTVDHQAASSSQLVAKRIGSACHDSGEIPTAKGTFGDLLVLHQSTSQLHHGKQTVGTLGEEEEPFSFWNMGRLERSIFVSSDSPLRALTMAKGRKRRKHTYDLVSSKSRKLVSED